MSRVAYINGRYVQFFEALTHIEDRGYQLADGVYEVIAIRNRLPIDLAPHLLRLDRSLAALHLEWPVKARALRNILHTMVERNHLQEGVLYIQVSRGKSRREHIFPSPLVRPTLVVTTRQQSLAQERLFEKGVTVITMDDWRWKRCDIKSISLLPNVLAKQLARERGAFEAWLLTSNNMITEGASSNAWIVTKDKHLITHPVSHAILGGVTRWRILDIAHQLGFTIIERPFTLEEAKQAIEAFLTSATTFILPVINIDGQWIHDGKPGVITRSLRVAYLLAVTSGIATW